MTDGAVPKINENPSTPLTVKLRVNNTFISSMVDTGSAKTIINIKTLQHLKYRPSIINIRKIHIKQRVIVNYVVPIFMPSVCYTLDI